jgi:probable HAF family extracellular repeat protein
MQGRRALTGVLAFVLVAGGHSFVTKAATPTVPVDDLGPAAAPTYARGVSPSGRAVGFGYDAGPSGFGFEQSVAPAFVPLPSGASELFAYAVNGAEIVTGTYRGADGVSRAFRYSAMSADWSDVPLLPGATSATAQGINDGSVVVGYSFTPSGARAFRQQPGLPAEDLGDFGGKYAAAFGINSSGVVVGESRDDHLAVRAFRFDGVLHALSPLAGSFARAAAINAAGIIVGYSSSTAGPLHAARWRSDTVVDDLGTLGGPTSTALGINAAGDIVGRADVGPYQPHAFLFKDDQMIDLNTLIDEHSDWLLQAAYGINDNGVVVGEGLFQGAPRAFRLTLPSDEKADVTAPFVAAVVATPDSLWPPKHQLVDVSVTASATDDSNESPSCQIAGITSSDPDNGTGDGDTAGDSVITGPLTAKLRAERSGGRERVYWITVQCSDAAGNVGTSSGKVVVPKNAK